MSTDIPDEPFLSRWSRQKQAGNRKSVAVEPPVAEVVPEVDPATLPKVEDLTADSDITVFLRKGVPEALQKLALRRMWSLDPEIRDFVEVAENQFDFHAPGGIPGLFQELPEGSDVSVWLAQATQSVVREDPKASSTVAQVNTLPDSEPGPSAAQQAASAEPDTTEVERPTASADEGVVRQPAAQVAEAAGKPGAATAQRTSTRRRHGGALPA